MENLHSNFSVEHDEESEVVTVVTASSVTNGQGGGSIIEGSYTVYMSPICIGFEFGQAGGC